MIMRELLESDLQRARDFIDWALREEDPIRHFSLVSCARRRLELAEDRAWAAADRQYEPQEEVTTT